MSYLKWVEAHAKKHAALMQKLKAQGLNKEQIIDYFDFDNMRKKEEDFCTLYAAKEKCHVMKKLNCFLCACPYFRFYGTPKNFSGKKLYSDCSIHSKNGKKTRYNNEMHQDCTNCIVPHTKTFVSNNYNEAWKTIMATCIVDQEVL